MTSDVFDVDNRVIHQKSQSKDQCKQSDSIDRVAEKKIHRERQAKHNRDSHCHDKGFSPAQAQGQQRDDNDNRDAKPFH